MFPFQNPSFWFSFLPPHFPIFHPPCLYISTPSYPPPFFHFPGFYYIPSWNRSMPSVLFLITRLPYLLQAKHARDSKVGSTHEGQHAALVFLSLDASLGINFAILSIYLQISR